MFVIGCKTYTEDMLNREDTIRAFFKAIKEGDQETWYSLLDTGFMISSEADPTQGFSGAGMSYCHRVSIGRVFDPSLQMT